jgi:hypothetical protein
MSAGDICQRSVEGPVPSVLDELLSLGQSNLDIWSIIRAKLNWQTQDAVTGSCRLARALSNAAVNTVRLRASEPPLEKDLCEVFPHAKNLDLCLEHSEGAPGDSLPAALRLEDWTHATPRLLKALKALTLNVNLDSLTHSEFVAEMLDLMAR